ncbi:alkylation response protein AidB-like acyl-CoA dehydrogenase [Paenibacillus phyllosphaerae]|uniref:Alkylation response protein AidB-like acyl-CoA dehydrogenase n=1 Tax=Paenibacillus phyllosphaerae TaxID=274593 RepID=A0A7W5B1L0_9BACL|nr:acyl-CoA dehydrogenase [Paenibacillus phyllosphaerae]MBB3112717.1 alkylation response protein AidB-like acyl-CoA dehydrogenase [Paenibacillus phyllosphaerae]
MERFHSEFVRTLRETAFEMEKAGVISESALQYIYEHGLFKLFLPEEVGGTMTALPEALRIFEQASWINGSFGWAITIGSGGNYFYSCFPASISAEVFMRKEAVIAGSGHPSGVARKVAGGYVLNGSWKYNSGSPYATTFTTTCTVDDPGKPGEQSILAFVVQPEQVRIEEDWDAFGLRSTASHTTIVTDAFVPEHLAFDVSHSTFHNHPIYRYPFLPFAEASFAAVAIGIGRHFLDEVKLLLDKHKGIWDRTNPSRSMFLHGQLEEAASLLEEQKLLFYDVIEASWARHQAGEQLTEAIWSEVGAQCKRAAKTAYTVAQQLFPYMGLGATMQHTHINQTWRDLQTVCHHSILVDYA